MGTWLSMTYHRRTSNTCGLMILSVYRTKPGEFRFATHALVGRDGQNRSLIVFISETERGLWPVHTGYRARLAHELSRAGGTHMTKPDRLDAEIARLDSLKDTGHELEGAERVDAVISKTPRDVFSLRISPASSRSWPVQRRFEARTSREFIRTAALREARERASLESRRWLDARSLLHSMNSSAYRRAEPRAEATPPFFAGQTLVLQAAASEAPGFIIDWVAVVPQRLVEGCAARLQRLRAVLLADGVERGAERFVLGRLRRLEG